MHISTLSVYVMCIPLYLTLDNCKMGEGGEVLTKTEDAVFILESKAKTPNLYAHV